MNPTTVLRGALAVCVTLLLSACASPPPPRVIPIDVPMPVLQRVPNDKIDPLVIEHELPDGDLHGRDVEARLLACEAAVTQANADRAWIRERQARRSGD